MTGYTLGVGDGVGDGEPEATGEGLGVATGEGEPVGGGGQTAAHRSECLPGPPPFIYAGNSIMP